MDNSSVRLGASRAALESLERRTFLSAGALDPTFGNAGLITITDPQHLFTATAAGIVQPDGLTVLAGTTQLVESSEASVARLDASGQPDLLFGDRGIVTLRDPGFRGLTVSALARLANGDILVAGSVVTRQRRPRAAIARLLPDGSLDSTFGRAGWVTIPFGAGAIVNAIAVTPSGQILLAGTDRSVEPFTISNMALTQLDSSGAIDVTFGRNGYVLLPFIAGRRHPGPYSTAANALAIESDGKIVVVGGGDKAVIARLTSNGAADVSFGVNGRATLPVAEYGFSSVAIADDGEIFAAGGAPVGLGYGSLHLVVADFTPAGQLNSTFARGGVFTQYLSAANGAVPTDAKGIAVLPSGKLLLDGDTSVGPFVERLNLDGTPDSSYGIDGKQLLTPGHAGIVEGLALAPDGGAVVPYDGDPFAFDDAPLESKTLLRALRFDSDGTPDTSFGNAGLATVAGPIGPGENDVGSIELMSDGTIYATGGTSEDGGFLAHLNSDGSPDSSFGTDGRQPALLQNEQVLPDGKLIGTTRVGLGEIDLKRLNPDGTPDLTFGSNGVVDLGEPGEGDASVLPLADGSLLVYEFAGGDTAAFAQSASILNPAGQTVATISASTDQSGAGTEIIQPIPLADGKFLTELSTTTYPPAGETIDLDVERLNPDLTLDTSYGNNGKVSVEPGFPYGRDLAAGPDGAAYAAGQIYANGTLTRITPAGQVDTTFGNGLLLVPGGIGQLLVQDDGKLLDVGFVASQLEITRYNLDGSLDNSFGDGGTSVVDLDGSVLDNRLSVSLERTNGVLKLLVGGTLGLGRNLNDGNFGGGSEGFVARIDL